MSELVTSQFTAGQIIWNGIVQHSNLQNLSFLEEPVNNLPAIL